MANRRVDHLSYDASGWQCSVGVPATRKVIFRAPSTARQKRLVGIIRRAAARLARGQGTKENLAKALRGTLSKRNFEIWDIKPKLAADKAIFARQYPPWFSHNRISKFTWLKMALYRRKIPPIAFSGFRYVTDLKVICSIGYHNRHLFQFPTRGKFVLYLIAELKHDPDTGVPYLDYLTLERSPRAWGARVF